MPSWPLGMTLATTHRAFAAALGLGLGLAATGCDGGRAPSTSFEGGVPGRDAPGGGGGGPLGPNLLVQCAPLGDAAPRPLVVSGALDGVEGSVAPGLALDEVLLAYGVGPAGPIRVDVEAVRSDGRPYDDAAPATPEHPRVVSPSLAVTPDALLLAYLHSGAPPFRAYATAKPFGLPWSAPVLLSVTSRAATRVRAVPVGAAALVVFAEEGSVDQPARLFAARVAEDGGVVSLAAPLDGTEGVTGFALAARGARASLVYDVPSPTGEGRRLVHLALRGADALPDGAPVIVADDRPMAGQPAVVRLAPYPEGEDEDAVLVAWTQLDGGVASEVYLAKLAPDAFESLLTPGAELGSDPALAPLAATRTFDGWFALAYRSPNRGTLRVRLARPFRTGGLVTTDVFTLPEGSGPVAAAPSPDGWSLALTWTESTPTGQRAVTGTVRCTDRQ